MRRENEARRAESAALRVEVGKLRGQLGKDSANSSKPPSSEGLKKTPRLAGSLRGKSGKTSGGQVGHTGGTLKRVETPDRIERHTASVCRCCVGVLSGAMQTGVEKRQVFDLPEGLIAVTEHQASIYCCAACGGETKADFPAGVAAPAQSGAAHPGGGGLSQRPAVDSGGPGRPDHERLVRRAASLPGQPDGLGERHGLGERQGGGVRRGDGAHRRACGGRPGSSSRRSFDDAQDGFRIAGQTQWLHTRVDRDPDLLSGVGKARRRAGGPRRRGCRARPFQALLRADRRRPRLLQRPSPARTQGADRIRRRALGQGHARLARPGQRGGAQRPPTGRNRPGPPSTAWSPAIGRRCGPA